MRLHVAADRPVAFAVARLCDVWPDGSSTLIARGVLNLCHRAGHDRPQALIPGEPVDVTISMKSAGYAVPAGHRLRLAISTSYWPWLWPSPEPVTLSIFTGGASVLRVPVRAPQAPDGDLPEFGPAEQAPPLEVTWQRARNPTQTVHVDPASGETRYLLMRDFSGVRTHPNGLTYGDYDPVTLTVREGDPLSARVIVQRHIEQRRGDWCVRIELRSEMTADAVDYLISTSIDAYEGDTRVHSRTHVASRPPGPLVIAGRLDNIDVVCTELEPMRAFYVDLLGLPLRLPYEPGQGWVGVRAGDVVIYLIEEDGAQLPPHPPPRFTGAANPPGLDSFAFEVEELDAAIAELDRHGVELGRRDRRVRVVPIPRSARPRGQSRLPDRAAAGPPRPAGAGAGGQR